MQRFKQHYITESKPYSWAMLLKTNNELKYGHEIMKIIKKAGYESLIVGGFVRDLLLDIPSNDVDIATTMPQKELEDMFDTLEVGKSFGVTMVKYKGFVYEIAQYRADVYSDLEKGKGAETVVLVKSFKDDAGRRDFKINSLGIDINGKIVDHYGGKDDIKMKKITTVGDPKLRFKEDAVRMLRAVRFSSKLNMDISPETKDTIKKMSHDIKKVAPERITKELLKMAKQEGTKFADAILTLDDVGLLKHILPEIYKMKEFEHEKEHHPEGGVFDHTLSALRANQAKDPILNLAILFHDVGKIKSQTKTAEGRIQYLTHAREGADMIDEISSRLKLDNKTRDAIKFSVLNHMKIHKLTKMGNNKIIKLMNDPNWNILLAVGQMDAKARGKLFKNAEWKAIHLKIDQITKKYAGKGNTDALTNIRKVVTGDLIMKLKKIKKPSKEVGDYIKQTVEWIVNNNVDVKNLKKIEQYIKSL